MNEQKIKKELLAIRLQLESIQDDVTHFSELAGEYVKDAIAKIDIALGHLDDEGVTDLEKGMKL